MMIRFQVAVVISALSLAVAACGGSEHPANDLSNAKSGPDAGSSDTGLGTGTNGATDDSTNTGTSTTNTTGTPASNGTGSGTGKTEH